jgi:hypothetical protein
MAGNFLRETLDATRNGVTSLKSWTGQTGWNTLAIPLRWLGQEDALGYLTKLCLKKQNKLGTWLKWHSACLASKRPSLSIKPSTAKKKEKYIKLWLWKAGEGPALGEHAWQAGRKLQSWVTWLLPCFFQCPRYSPELQF